MPIMIGQFFVSIINICQNPPYILKLY